MFRIRFFFEGRIPQAGRLLSNWPASLKLVGFSQAGWLLTSWPAPLKLAGSSQAGRLPRLAGSSGWPAPQACRFLLSWPAPQAGRLILSWPAPQAGRLLSSWPAPQAFKLGWTVYVMAAQLRRFLSATSSLKIFYYQVQEAYNSGKGAIHLGTIL